MRIAYITAGAAEMYCGSCIHDNTLAAALQGKGHQVALIPTYTPLRTDEPSISQDQLFYSGINVFLQQKYGLFRRTPWIVDSLFARPRLVRLLARLGSSTDARELGALTVSVLKGEEGNQAKELAKLIQWLQDSVQPEIVELTNSMFLGLAGPIRKALGIPVLCALQGEDLFLENLVEPYKSQARRLLQERSGDADAFIATSDYYASFMADYLQLRPEKIHVVRLGLNLSGHGRDLPDPPEGTLVIGYLARVCPEKGLHLLVEAFVRLAEELGSEQVFLKVAGYLARRDKPYLMGLQKRISQAGLEDRFQYAGEVDRRQKIEFLNSLHVLSVPTTYREPKGLYVLEALANGVPVVQPCHGAFPELIQHTRGGLLVEPHSPEALAEGLLSLAKDSEQRKALGRQGRESVLRTFSDEVMADQTLAVYRQYTGSPP